MEQQQEQIEAYVDGPDDEAGARSLSGPGQWTPMQVAHAALGAAGLILTALLVVAMFLPWASSGTTSQSLAEYAAPQPAIIAWTLLAFGVSTAVISGASIVLSGRRGAYGLAVGGVLYAIGAVIWYGAAVWPAVVASGCQSNGGPLCAAPATSPTTAGATAGAGFVLGLIAALLLIALALIGPAVIARRVDLPQDC